MRVFNDSVSQVYYPQTNSEGFTVTSIHNLKEVSLIKNGVGVVVDTETQDAAHAAETWLLGCLRQDGTPSQFGNYEYSFCCIGDYLTPTENAVLYDIVQAFQTSLGREVMDTLRNKKG